MLTMNRWVGSALFSGLATAAVVPVACSSDTKNGGSGGTSATGGGSPGGASGQGGGATGGNKATGGNPNMSDAATGCSSRTDTAPADGLIADFVGTAADSGIEIMGGVTTYGGTAKPTATISGAALHITEDVAATSAAQYVGTVLFFNDCVDASAFKGVEFTISGTMTAGCSMQYSTNYSGADDVSTDPKGSCTLGTGNCYSPQKAVTLPTTPTAVQVAWADATGGNPVGAVNTKELTGIQWQFTVAAGSVACTADVTITGVKFFN